MPLVTTNEMLKKAQAGHYAVGALQRGKYGNGHGGY